MTLFDDDLMTRVFNQNIPATEMVLKMILGKDVHIKEHTIQKEYLSPITDGRNITLDVVAVDENGVEMDIEVQGNEPGSHVRRARFHSAAMDHSMLKKKQNFKELRDSYIIFIYKQDKFGKGLPIYRASKFIEETGEPLNDGSHIIYVNGTYNGDDEIGKLMHDFNSLTSEGMNYKELAEGVHHFKETEEGRDIMCESVKRYAEEYKTEDKIETVKNLMKNKGFGVDFGAVYKYNDDMTFSASIVDFGFIKWKTNSTAIKSKNPGERVEFSGINSTYDNIGDDIDDYFDEMEDSIKRAFDLGVEDLGSYTTMVPVKLYLGYSWQFEKKMYLNALYRGRFISGGYENSLSLNYTYKNGFFQISAGNTINHRFFNPGIYLGLGNIFYMGADYSKSVNLAKTKGLSFYFGLNIAVGKKSVKKVKTEQENTETNETSFLER